MGLIIDLLKIGFSIIVCILQLVNELFLEINIELFEYEQELDKENNN